MSLYRIVPVLLAMSMFAAAGASAAPSASIALDQASPTFGSQVTFTVTLPNPKPNETFWVRNSCVQDGSGVYFDVRAPTGVFTLGPTLSWAAGPTDCEASVWSARNGRLDHVLATTNYQVTG